MKSLTATYKLNDDFRVLTMADNDPYGATHTFPDDVDDSCADTAPASPGVGPSTHPERIGRYRVEKILGRGASGMVYRAFDEQLDRHVAIKVPHDRLVSKPEATEAYLNEARTVANLSHPHIVPVYDVGSSNDSPCFIVSKYIEGADLATRLRQSRPNHAQAAEWIATVAEALHYAHKRGLVHRDVKPKNILVGADNKPYIVDFGLALWEENIGRGPNYAGTTAYMSPEQARGEGHRVDGRSDVYSLGAVLYELLTGRRTFSGETKLAILEKIALQEPRPPRQIDDQIPKELERICLKALSNRASERYTTAFDMAEDLQHFLASHRSAGSTAAASAAEKQSGFDSTQCSPESTTVDRDTRFIRIVPKGLRSFDEHDADFFLELLPGPRDRDGLPDSLRFWKTRIEATQADQTFSVGLIYGPSGCGKSSLVKAGLLPRLTTDVLPVYVEATAKDTETRLLNGLLKPWSAPPADFGLKRTLAALRRGEDIPPGRKVVIFLDQFEQWLHAKKEFSRTELVQALRQCDGGRLQCIVMVRDDFWLAVSRFMKALEVEILEGQNSALVDLFDPIHARKVLAAFGTAYGRLPRNLGQCTGEQDEFLDQAVAGLLREGKVISVRLALFAEMVKGKPWTPATLREIGGIRGIGVTFLEETFTAPTAPPEHRLHHKAAQAVLKALLPEAGTNIKGHMRSEQDLQDDSGYANRPNDFAELIRILDRELRLITPTDPEGMDDADPAVVRPGARHYQLTHDYLVAPLRDWLTRKQKETRRGRAELRLAERAALWNAKRENRHLPAWWEWLSIRLFTRRGDWNSPQRKMMHRAGRYLAVRGALLAICLALLFGGSWESLGRVRSQFKIDTLLHAPTSDVPALVEAMAGYRRWLHVPLQELFAQAQRAGDERKQLHISLALLPADDSQVEYLFTRLLTGSPTEVVVIRTSMKQHAPAVGNRMWKILEDPKANPSERLRAACFLAAYAPDDSRWEAVSGDVMARLATESAMSLKHWAEALRPVGKAMLPALANLVAESRGAREHRTLAEIYAEFASDEADGFGPLEAVLAQDYGDEPTARLSLARRQAAAAAALATLERWDQVWPLLRHTPDPTLRTCLIERLGNGEVQAQAVIDRLNPDHEPNEAIRRASILILGDFGDDRLPLIDRDRLVPRLLDLYQDDSDSGIRGALSWVLRQWGKQRELAAIEQRGQYPRMIVVSPGGIDVTDKTGQRHHIRVDKRFALGAQEVTVAEYLRFRAHHVWDERSAQSHDCPVNEVSWYDAAAYCNWLSREEGLAEDQWCYVPNENGKYAAGMKVKANARNLSGYRLPTSAEWEFACRAGTVTHWSVGDAVDQLDRYAWSMANSGVHSRPVGLLRPNELGFFDLHGNVWEWCQDRVNSRGMEAAVDPLRDEVVDDTSYRPLRGGTFLNDPMALGSASSIWNPAANHTGADGFRVARTVP